MGFKARRRDDNTDEFAVADVDPPQQFKVLVPNAKGGPKVTWLPDNSGVVFMMNNPLVQGNKLYSVNRKNPGPPQLLPDQPRDQIVLDADWSPDGKWIVATIQQVPQPIEWHGEPITPAGQVAH